LKSIPTLIPPSIDSGPHDDSVFVAHGNGVPQPANSVKGLDVSHLRKSYGDLVAVDDLSFHVNPGEIFGLIGPNGAGKSTCMMMIVGLLSADSGAITFDGRPYDPRDPQMRAKLGIVPQELAVYPDLTAAQNLNFFGGLYGLHGARLKERVDYVLELTGLTRNADHTLDTFSGGMSRRLNFGIALLHEPQFVVLDEPTVGIDPQSRSNLLDSVKQLGKNGVGVVYASHYMEEVEAVCDRVAIVDRGRMLKQGTLDELLDRSGIELCVKVEAVSDELRTRLSEFADVRSDPDDGIRIMVREKRQDHSNVRPVRLRAVLDLLESASIPIQSVETLATSLETLFLRMTGRKLRD
jgi:ABC-2 type transport system ATP-binding protein